MPSPRTSSLPMEDLWAGLAPSPTQPATAPRSVSASHPSPKVLLTLIPSQAPVSSASFAPNSTSETESAWLHEPGHFTVDGWVVAGQVVPEHGLPFDFTSPVGEPPYGPHSSDLRPTFVGAVMNLCLHWRFPGFQKGGGRTVFILPPLLRR